MVIFNLSGIPTDIEIIDICIDKIDLDPNNPRLGYWRDNLVTDDISQDDIAFALREDIDDVRKLKYSIEVNEGIINPIWVIKNKKRFVVIDGNTRVEIYRELSNKYPQKETYKKIRCRVLPEDIDEKCISYIQLIEHLRGVNEWHVYERARVLYILWEEKGYTQEELMSQTNLTISEIKKWIKAYKEMTEQFLPKYGSDSDALTKFSYFLEYQNPKILTGMAENNLTIENFCDWVGKKEIIKAQDVRNLREIFKDVNSANKLKSKGYKYAMSELSKSKPSLSSRLFESIEDVIIGLKNMPLYEEEEILDGDNPKKELLLELYATTGMIVKKMGK